MYCLMLIITSETLIYIFFNLRNEQSDLMNESVKLYEAAEMGNEKLKKVIQTKDSKLQQAEMELIKLRKVGLVQSITSSTAHAKSLYFVSNMDIQQ